MNEPIDPVEVLSAIRADPQTHWLDRLAAARNTEFFTTPTKGRTK